MKNKDKVEGYAASVADKIEPDFKNKMKSCTSVSAKKWQAAYDAVIEVVTDFPNHINKGKHMTHIPDEAVRAAIGGYRGHATHDSALRAAIIAAIPNLPLGYEVKKLEWVDPNETQADYEAETSFGSYIITYDNWVLGGTHYLWMAGSEDGDIYHSEYENTTEAKAAAQADFERRVRECVIAKPVDVASVYREALERISRFDHSHGSWDTVAYDAINIAGRALSVVPAQGGYSAADELRDLHQSILQSETLADFNAIKNTVNFIYNAPTTEAEA